MKSITEMPETPEIGNCEKHGEYEFKYIHMMNDRVWVKDCCSECVKEDTEKKEKEEAEKNEKERVEHIRKMKLLRRENAGISKRNLGKTFDDYICQTKEQQQAKDSCISFMQSFPAENNLLMLGGVGTGKTLLASAMLETIVDTKKCRIAKVSKIMRSFKGSWDKDSDYTEDDVSDYYIGLDLLIIDEVGTQFGSEMEKLFMFEIIDGRYQDMKQTILISNLDVKGVGEVIGERCLDRLRDCGGSMVAFNWGSNRA